MNTKNKSIITLALSALILSLGVIYYTNLTEQMTIKRGDLYVTESLLLPQKNITPSVNLENSKSTKTSRSTSRSGASNFVMPIGSSSNEFSLTNNLSSSRVSSATTKDNSYTGQILTKREDNIYSTTSNPSSIGLLSYRSASNGVSSTPSGGSLVGVGSANPPTFVPFASNGSDVILVDPMPDTEMILLPVGEGWWILLLMGIGYLGYRRMKL